MRHDFENTIPITIESGAPGNVSSQLTVSEVQGRLNHLSVTIDVDHTYTSDLEISLLGPNNQRVLLVGREGGSGDNFRETTFDDRSPSSIGNAFPPFQGIFCPQEQLAIFNDIDPMVPGSLG